MDAENATTKGEFEEVGEGDNVSWLPFWSAESDMISVYATKVSKNPASSTPFSDDDLETTNMALYKATRSERNAYFTASNQTDILDFKADVTDETPATFLAVYPNTIELNAKATPNWKDGFDVTLKLTHALTAKQTQTNTEGKGIYEFNAKYAVTTGYPEADNKVAVGENVPLKFNRILSGLVFRTKGVDAYTNTKDNVFGKLKTIKVVADGEYKDGEKVTEDGESASKLTYGDESTVIISVKADGTTETKTTDFKNGETSVTLNLATSGAGLDWNDDARGYMVIKPVSRIDADKKAWNEGIKVTYTFENIEFTQVLETANSWNANEFIPVPALDINEYPWLVTKATAYDATGLTLILNEGADFSKVYNASDNTVNWNWIEAPSTSHTTVDAKHITRIISNIDLTDAQLATIGDKFTGLTTIEYNVETSIPAGAFKSQAANITKLVMPKVTKIDAKFTNQALLALKVLNLESYTFPSTEINYLLFNGMEEANNSVLEELNMKAVKDMTAEFNENRTLAFEAFTALKTVVMGENVIASQKAFKGCTNLVSVSGSLDLNTANAVEAFMDAGTNGTYDPKKPDETFNTINITSDEIPADAFNGATNIVNVLKGGAQVVPTYIGKNAFKGATNLQYMDLSKATTIGTDAFNGATKYQGVSGTARLDVNAATIESGILAGTAVVNVYFANATKVNGPIFEDASALEQVEFAKKFTAATLVTDGWDNAFGTSTSSVDLFIQNGQDYYDRDNANVLSLPETADGKVITSNDIIFKSIKVRTAE